MNYLQYLDKFQYLLSIGLSRFINRNKNPKHLTFQSILFIRMDEIGDMCYSLHVFKIIKDQYPNAHLTLWCKPPAASLARNSSSLNAVVTDASQLDQHYDLIIDLRGREQGLWFALKHLPKYRLERGSVRLKNKKNGAQPHELITNFNIIQPLLDKDYSLQIPQIEWSNADEFRALEFISKNSINKFALLHTTAKRTLKEWPAERYVEVAKLLNTNYQLAIIFCGDKDDTEKIQAIQSQLPFSTYSIAGDFSLGAFAALCKTASFFIGNDSSPLHIASLCNVPSLGLFGPGQSDTFYPYGKRSTFLHHILPCNPCDQIHCKHPLNPCIQRISLEEVSEKIRMLMDLQ
jgi:ADP-heptose:LPS heptosyltransferase